MKAIYDRAVPTRNLVTTISGILTLLVTILVAFGVIKPEQQADVQAHVTTLIEAGIAIWAAIQGLLLIFKYKD